MRFRLNMIYMTTLFLIKWVYKINFSLKYHIVGVLFLLLHKISVQLINYFTRNPAVNIINIWDQVTQQPNGLKNRLAGGIEMV